MTAEVKELLLHQFSHVRLRVMCFLPLEEQFFQFDSLPAQNLVSLKYGSMHHLDAPKDTGLHKLLLESKQLKTLELMCRINLLPTGRLRPVRALQVAGWYDNADGNPALWDFSRLRYLEIVLPDARPMINAPHDESMPQLKILHVIYRRTSFAQEVLQFPRNWATDRHEYREAVEKFLQHRSMPQLEVLTVECSQPLLLAPTLARFAPSLKTVTLWDLTPPTFVEQVQPVHVEALSQSCPGLQSIEINLPRSIMDLDDEVRLIPLHVFTHI
jgi:hypothetical protein